MLREYTHIRMQGVWIVCLTSGLHGWSWSDGSTATSFILHPRSSMPFCCGVSEQRQMLLSSGTYLLIDLHCPNGACNANLGWKYHDCVGEGDRIPVQNFNKIGQFWVFAELLKVAAPS